MPEDGKVDKLIVYNREALTAKYGAAGLKKILAAVKSLRQADKQRGLKTVIRSVSDPDEVGQYAVTDPENPKQNKKVIDYLYQQSTPDYLLILGATDVIPHQDLKNPLYGEDDDDRFAYGDLPYACDAPYSKNPSKFFGPTRVVGRLPDLTGGADPQYLINLLKTAATYKQSDPDRYSRYFGITAEVWEDSTRESLRNTFNNSSSTKNIPPSSHKWSASYLGRLSHFINCHGNTITPQFVGQSKTNPNDYPISQDAAYIEGRISEGTVAAVECCYGAELYNPSLASGRAGICSTYLSNKSYGYLGSTTIAYGPAEGNDAADYICQFFLQSVLRGASVGRAALEARQKFLHTADMADPMNVKTIAQFNLYGDVSLTPVKVPQSVTAASTKAARSAGVETSDRVERAARRRDLFSRGAALAGSQPRISKVSAKALDSIDPDLARIARAHDITPTRALTFQVKDPPAARSMPKALMSKDLAPSRVHVVFSADKAGPKVKGKAAKQPIKRVVALVAIVVKEVDGKVVSVKKTFSR